MPIPRNIRRLIGRPVGVSLTNGQGVSGILCDVRGNEIFLMEYLYQSQFAMKHYSAHMVQDINPYPPCRTMPQPPAPGPRPRPPRPPMPPLY